MPAENRDMLLGMLLSEVEIVVVFSRCSIKKRGGASLKNRKESCDEGRK